MSDEEPSGPDKVIAFDFGSELPKHETQFGQILTNLCILQAYLDTLVSMHIVWRFPEPGRERNYYAATLRNQISELVKHHLDATFPPMA